MQTLDLDAAIALYESLPAAIAPSTLHPAYVAADAQRDRGLRPVYSCYAEQGEHWLHGLHLSNIPGTAWNDASSPYGYGGPLSTSDDPAFLTAAWAAHEQWMRANGVVVEYLRFHPLLRNGRGYRGHLVPNRTVVSVDLGAGDIAAGYAPRLRSTVNKASRAGLIYEERPLSEAVERFGAFHRAAMREIGAGDFYIFDDRYFDRMSRLPRAILGTCRVAAGGAEDWLAVALFLDGCGVREYHLAGASAAGRKSGAASFLLHESALAAKARGLTQLFLGGGTDAKPDNPLFFFKSGFSSNRIDYHVGWNIFDPSAHDELKLQFDAEWRAYPHRPIFYRSV